ncbi:GNAT family N-acetyltransferase [Embleya scabrispora]|uniref:GNAT family N-acetyltransferase n=1 Tax=Embleya scabrispora TaxID=159449 RepID=UPI000379DA27|nr:GNAT family N-acetyltransferase [Embleya scabrispora]MYS83870.1 GNAT family N-acetyltransferase [Streptomyces sp. SID5474]
MEPKIELFRPTDADDRLRTEIHRVFHDVARLGGAIGYLSPPSKPTTDVWLEDALAAVRAGDAALVVALVDGSVAATGLWRRRPEPVFAHTADVEKVMAHPTSRGLGLGRLLMTALIDSARRAGIETLALGVRGNNHGAIELYEEFGFTVWGRLPNVIEVDNERFDDIRMALTLGHGPDVVLRGSTPGGPGSSPRRPLSRRPPMSEVGEGVSGRR